ncbi:antitoxin VapB family protein [Halorussus amylolyticus]|uniref:antitoxin VapB family protein n=1 Tax=Halorussus amylolyticus TaxID=1126242 RepID=UPI00104EBB33|nr:antitoxin VapB family protein [Halorussus amylolyticus]
MGTKTIRVSEEIYDRLEARKRESESFTDLLARLTEEERDIYAGFGAWANTDATEKMREAHENLNESLDDDTSEFRNSEAKR